MNYTISEDFYSQKAMSNLITNALSLLAAAWIIFDAPLTFIPYVFYWVLIVSGLTASAILSAMSLSTYTLMPKLIESMVEKNQLSMIEANSIYTRSIGSLPVAYVAAVLVGSLIYWVSIVALFWSGAAPITSTMAMFTTLVASITLNLFGSTTMKIARRMGVTFTDES